MKKYMKWLWIACGVSVVLELFLHRHGHFEKQGFYLDGFFSFYAIFGLLVCIAFILISKFIGIVLRVKEDYYGESIG